MQFTFLLGFDDIKMWALLLIEAAEYEQSMKANIVSFP